MAHETLRFEFVDGTAELVRHGSVRYAELLEDGHTPVGSVPESDGISDPLEAFLAARFGEAVDTTDTAVATALESGTLSPGVVQGVVESAVTAPGPVKDALSATYVAGAALGGLLPPPLVGVSTPALGTTPHAVDVFDGYVWGINTTGDLYRSADDGATWTLYDATYPGTGLNRLIPTDDGEVLACAANGVWKSTSWATGSPTWTKKITPLGTCQMLPWSLDGNGTKFITTEYSSDNRADSRYVYVSLDAGDTFTVAYDSVTVHGATLGNGSHLHGCAYDPWSDRFYFTEGHDDGGASGDIAGVYCSTDDGATWARAAGMAQNPGPTVLHACPDGLVCGSDNAENGLYGVIRRDNPTDERLVQTWSWRTGREGLVGFARRAYTEPDTGMVYVVFSTNFADVAPVIAAGTPTSGALVYTYPGTVVPNDYIRSVVLPERGRLLSSVSANGANLLLTAATGKPGARDASLNDPGSVLGGNKPAPTSTAVGRNSTATGIRSVAVGPNANAGATGAQDNVVVGEGAALGSTTAAGVVLVGRGAVGAASSVVLGSAASGGAANSEVVVVGAGATASGGLATALGRSASAGATGTALGSGASVGSAHTWAVAIGRNAATTAGYQVAIGPRHFEITEIGTVPTTPAANGARLYVADNGAGKTGLYIKFSDGVAQQIAIQP